MQYGTTRCWARILLTLFALSAMGSDTRGWAAEWKRIVLNADSDFEAAGVADFNNDGILDIVSGDTWYQGPNWQIRHAIGPIASMGGYRLDFANVPMDVNGDGWMDIVSCNWHRRSVVWRENPGGAGEKGGPWREHGVDVPGNMETALAVDVDGDGTLDFLPDIQQQTRWYRLTNGKLVGHTISPNIGGHGIGFGDVNGDGRGDILKPEGWFEAPVDRLSGTWTWHPQWSLGAAGISIIAHDFTGDGRADVFWGMGHGFGRSWLERTTHSDPDKQWQRHEVDRDWSQSHAMVLVDLDGDGVQDILTGKRKFAHNGHDPGGREPLLICSYTFDRKTQRFRRTMIHEGGDDGMGLTPQVVDIDKDGDMDFIAPGKSGLYLYLQ